MTSKQQETVNNITKARATERPELVDPITVTEEGKNVFINQGALPPVRVGASGGIYLPASKSFANSTPQNSPTPMEAAVFPDRYMTEAIAARLKEQQKAEPVQAEVAIAGAPKPEATKATVKGKKAKARDRKGHPTTSSKRTAKAGRQ